MNSARRKLVLYGLAAVLVVAVIVALAPHGRGGGGKGTQAPTAAASRTSAATRSPAPASAASSLAPSHTSPQSRRPPLQPPRAAPWKAAAVSAARPFVTWFDRWLAGESTARQAPHVTRRYAATLRATVNNVPPGARRQVAAIVSLIPAGMPPTAAHPHEAWIYTTTRSNGALVRFTVEERLTAGHWLVYSLYQGS